MVKSDLKIFINKRLKMSRNDFSHIKLLLLYIKLVILYINDEIFLSKNCD